jgi:SEC-C motif
MTNPGRNDPCHCGSGKKYKKCHLEADQRGRAASLKEDGHSESPAASLDVKSLSERLRQLSRQGSAADRREFSQLLSKTEPILDYMARREEIEAAAAELETHRAEFDRFSADERRFLALARSVFAEECFIPLRFTASDVQRAFDHVGYPAMMSPDEQSVQILRAAILHAADEERRGLLSMGLLSRLPEFVAAGRYLEGWLLQCSAEQTAEDPGESNAFLFQMFSYGYDAWAADKRAKDESLLRRLGLDSDVLRSMNLDEIDSWMRSQLSDSAKAAAMEEFFRKNPRLRQESVANLEAMERNSGRLLEREDSRFLRLPVEEVQPWLALLNERASQQGILSGTPSEESVRKSFEEVALRLMREMADSIFTPERIGQLVAALRKYRSELFAAGDKTAAGQVTGAIHYLEREDSPGQNSFLLRLCWASLNSAIETAGVDYT